MGVIKRHMWCPVCKGVINTYVQEGKSLAKTNIKCKCGVKMVCISDNGKITKWREVE